MRKIYGRSFKRIITTKSWTWKDLVSKGVTLEHCLFIKKDKLAHGTIILNVFDFLLHHVACGEIAKDICDDFFATFEKNLHVGNKS